MTGAPRLRRDPLADQAQDRVPGHARLRLDRSRSSDRTAAAAAEPAQTRTISIDAAAGFIIVVPDAEGGLLSLHDRQVLGAARRLADAASACVLVLTPPAHPALRAELARAGADRLACLAGLGGAWPEVRAAAIQAAIRVIAPLHVLFPESPDGADLARRVAVLTGAALLPDAEALSPRAAVRAAEARAVEHSVKPPLLVSLQAGRALPYVGLPHVLRDHDWEPPPPPCPQVGDAPVLRRGDPASISLTEADFVVAAGQGVTDFERFGALVAALGATPGASRMVCDLGLLPRDRQVGASGSVLDAQCYVALGISGAPQHLQGVGGVAHIIAVNTDLHAAMVERAELAIIADAQAVSVALLAALATRA